jgi:hypothetical protein
MKKTMPKSVTDHKSKFNKYTFVTAVVVILLSAFVLWVGVSIYRSVAKVNRMEELSKKIDTALGGGFKTTIGGSCTLSSGGCPYLTMKRYYKTDLEVIKKQLVDAGVISSEKDVSCGIEYCSADDVVNNKIKYGIRIYKDKVIVDGENL